MVRHKNRYMLVEINELDKDKISSLNLKPPSLYFSIQEKVQQLHGDFGVAAIQAGFIAKYFNEYTRIALIRARHGPHKLVTSSIPFIRTIESKRVAVNILYIGATIKQCFKFLKIYQQKKCDEYCVSLKTEEEKEELRRVMLNFESKIGML